MEKELLRKCQLAQLEILKEFKRVCEELGLKYWLDYGTLLGAVRHKGFIPWDDDLDVSMLREDYERFLKEGPQVLSKDYFLQTWDTDEGFVLPFAKIRKNGTVFIEDGTESVNMHHGVYIDIFPIDVFPENQKEQKKEGKWFYTMRRILLAKAGYKPWETEEKTLKRMLKAVAYGGLKCVSLFANKKAIIAKWKEKGTQFNKSPFPYLYPQAGASAFGKYQIPREILEGKMVSIAFEDDLFSAPEAYQDYLTHLYGDYMTPPPEDQRENRHHLVEVKL